MNSGSVGTEAHGEIGEMGKTYYGHLPTNQKTGDESCFSQNPLDAYKCNCSRKEGEMHHRDCSIWGLIAHIPDGKKHDAVNHPKHYTSHPSGVECIQVTEHFGFNLGNVIKYLWRAEDKGAPLEDLKKARWYLDREIQKREGK